MTNLLKNNNGAKRTAMITKNKLSGFLERVKGDKRPITAEIFLTEYCNLSCEYCRYKHENGKYLDFEKFVSVVERLVSIGCKSIILTGGGEPTIHKDFGKITKYLEDCHIPYGINTNMLKPLNCSPVFVKISVDTGSNERYKEIRGKNVLNQVCDNIKDYNSRKGNTRVGVQCVATTKEDVISFVQKFAFADVDYLYVRPKESCKKSKDDYKNSVLEWISEALQQYTFTERKKIKEKINISFKFDFCDKHYKKCSANWSVITINANGDVIYCCHKPNEVIGSVFDEDIIEKKRAYKTDMRLCETPCRLSGANDFCDKFKENDSFFI